MASFNIVFGVYVQSDRKCGITEMGVQAEWSGRRRAAGVFYDRRVFARVRGKFTSSKTSYIARISVKGTD